MLSSKQLTNNVVKKLDALALCKEAHKDSCQASQNAAIALSMYIYPEDTDDAAYSRIGKQREIFDMLENMNYNEIINLSDVYYTWYLKFE